MEVPTSESTGARLPTRGGEFSCCAYRDGSGTAHVILSVGEVAGTDDVLVRVHSECLTGDVFGSVRCDCGPQLDEAMRLIQTEGTGVVLYLRGHEGRGIGIEHKLHAYRLQDAGLDTVDANLELGLPVDDREYAIAAEILTALGVTSVRLLTNNPDKVTALESCGVDVRARVPLLVPVHPEAERYLATKRDRMGHDLPAAPSPTQRRTG